MSCDSDWRTTHESSALTEENAGRGVGGEGGINCGLLTTGNEMEVGVKKGRGAFGIRLLVGLALSLLWLWVKGCSASFPKKFQVIIR
jgi:hypothetical protein